MHGPLSDIYLDTIHAQTALIRLRERILTSMDTLEDWNTAEEELLSAHERFQAHRRQSGPVIPQNPASPGLAGVSHGASPAAAAIDTPATI